MNNGATRPLRDRVAVAIPTYDGKLDSAILLGLLSCTQFYSHMPIIMAGNAYVQLARNDIAHRFVEKMPECDWLMCIDADMRFTADDWRLLWQGDEQVVCAEYAYKYFDRTQPVRWGLGFTRIHRSVFEGIRALKTEDGQDLVRRYYREGEMHVDYHTQHVSSEGKFVGEDYGFFQWVSALPGIKARLETRTRLGHVGQYCFRYPDKTPDGYQLNDGAGQ